MNRLVTVMMENTELPSIVTPVLMEKYGVERQMFKKYAAEGINAGYIHHIYGDIYTLNTQYRKKPVPKCALTQILIPDSYVSHYYVLRQSAWIPETIFAVTCITKSKDITIDTEKFGTLLYIPIKKKLSANGIHTEKDYEGTYKRASLLRALCDLLYITNKNFNWSLLSIEEEFRILPDYLEEDLTGNDFDELHGVFGVSGIESFLEGARKELGK